MQCLQGLYQSLSHFHLPGSEQGNQQLKEQSNSMQVMMIVCGCARLLLLIAVGDLGWEIGLRCGIYMGNSTLPYSIGLTDTCGFYSSPFSITSTHSPGYPIQHVAQHAAVAGSVFKPVLKYHLSIGRWVKVVTCHTYSSEICTFLELKAKITTTTKTLTPMHFKEPKGKIAATTNAESCVTNLLHGPSYLCK